MVMNRITPFFACLAVCLLVLICISAPLTNGQAINATLFGRVLDTSGGSVGKATVTITSSATGFVRTAQSSDSGEYTIPALPAGEYTVSVEYSGFSKQSKNVILQVGQAAELDFALTPGAVAEKVEVGATSELVETTRTEVSTVITQRQIVNLPVNGRDFIAVDGADDISTASGIQRGTPPQESVQEFRVINTDYSAEFGRATAGIVNIITRSGTNEWHGTLYEYFRNDKMDAVSILSAPGFNVLRQNQFGGAIGGPIRKDKTFIFANYEGQRRTESPTYNSTVLTNIAAINTVKTTVYGLPAA